jgi:hypothetical protein
MARTFDQFSDATQAISYAEESLIILDEIASPYATAIREQIAEWKSTRGTS